MHRFKNVAIQLIALSLPLSIVISRRDCHLIWCNGSLASYLDEGVIWLGIVNNVFGVK